MGSGPIEYMIVGFPGNKFNGKIIPELGALIDKGTIRILDVVVISKNDAGDVEAFEVDQLEDAAAFASLEGEVGGILSQEDIDYAAASMEPGSTVGLLIWEDLWAIPFVDALRASGGILFEGGRIPEELAQEALAAIKSA